MFYAILCTDKPDHQQLRADNRPAHLAYLEAHAEQILIAGPLPTEDGSAVTGSLLVLDFPDRAAAEAFAEQDPYAQAGLFESVSIKPFRKVMPKD